MQHLVLYTVCWCVKGQGWSRAYRVLRSIRPWVHTYMIQNNLRPPQLAGFTRQLGCKNWLQNHCFWVSKMEQKAINPLCNNKYCSLISSWRIGYKLKALPVPRGSNTIVCDDYLYINSTRYSSQGAIYSSETTVYTTTQCYGSAKATRLPTASM